MNGRPAPITTFAEALRDGIDQLTRAGVQGAALDVRLLLAHAAGVSAETPRLYPERTLSPSKVKIFNSLLAGRAARQPVAHLLGRREFWSLDFAVTPDTLVPRPDSETVVEAALAEAELLGGGAWRLLDLGTGSGCLLLAILSECGATRGVGTDIHEAALGVARANAVRLGLADRAHFLQADWTAEIDGRFDMVVSNPPYIETAAIDTLEPEVATHDPRRALDGGADGLDAYRRIADGINDVLAPGGCCILEIGHGQADAVAAVMLGAGLRERRRASDLAGMTRALIFARP